MQFIPFVSSFLLLGTAAYAQDGGPTWDFYGHLNLGVIDVDDGVDSNSTLADNDISNSRIGFNLTQKLDGGANLRVNVETALGLRGTAALDGGDDSFDARYSRTELRKFEAIYTTASAGTLSFGQGSMSTDGAAEADLSGTAVGGYASIQDLIASQTLRRSDGSLSGLNGGATHSSFDGGRRFRLRYDTPSFSGLRLTASGGGEVLVSGNDAEYYALGARYAQDYGAIKVDGRVAYGFNGTASDTVIGSTSLRHQPSGISLTGAAGRRIDDDARYGYLKVGVERSYLSVGSTAVSLDLYRGDDFAIAGSSSGSVGLTLVQDIDAYSVEAFATYRRYDFDAPDAEYRDIDVLFAGARWSF